MEGGEYKGGDQPLKGGESLTKPCVPPYPPPRNESPGVQEGVVYQAKITNNRGEEEKYVGIAKKFKQRYSKHKKSMKKKIKTNSTTLSTHFWKEMEGGRQPKVEWKILERNIPSFNPVTEICRLCIREKFRIAFNPEEATLNLRTEIFGHCRHIDDCLFKQNPDQSHGNSTQNIIYHCKVFLCHC